MFDDEYHRDVQAAAARAAVRENARIEARRTEIAAEHGGIWTGNLLVVRGTVGGRPDTGEGCQGYDPLLGYFAIW